MPELRSARQNPAVAVETPSATRFPLDDYAITSFVWWAVHDAWRAGDPGMIDTQVIDFSIAARNESLPIDYREHAVMHVLQAGVLAMAKEQLADRMQRGTGFSVADTDVIVAEANTLRRPMAQLGPMTASFCKATLPQLEQYLDNDEVPEDVKLATEFLIESQQVRQAAAIPAPGGSPRAPAGGGGAPPA